jgi:hypothetical protein
MKRLSNQNNHNFANKFSNLKTIGKQQEDCYVFLKQEGHLKKSVSGGIIDQSALKLRHCAHGFLKAGERTFGEVLLKFLFLRRIQQHEFFVVLAPLIVLTAKIKVEYSVIA